MAARERMLAAGTLTVKSILVQAQIIQRLAVALESAFAMERTLYGRSSVAPDTIDALKPEKVNELRAMLAERVTERPEEDEDEPEDESEDEGDE